MTRQRQREFASAGVLACHDNTGRRAGAWLHPGRLLAALTIILLTAPPARAENNRTIEGLLEIAQNMFVIVMDQPIKETSYGEVVESNRVMLVGYSGEQVEQLNELVGQRVRASGVLGPAHTRHHTEPFIIGINSIPQVIESAGRTRAVSTASTPPAGSPLRRALMDAIRAHDFYPNRAAARTNARNILFQVYFLKVHGDWALAHVGPLQNGQDYAEPRWCLLHKDSAGDWSVVDYLRLLAKYYKDDADFFSALDMDKRAVGYLRKELPQIPADIFP